jgi:hypothetical protein
MISAQSLGVTLPRIDLNVIGIRYMECIKGRVSVYRMSVLRLFLNTATRKGFGHVTAIEGDIDLPQVIVVVQHGLGPRKAAHPILGGQALLKGI